METRIFAADDVSEKGLEPLRDAGFAVEKRVGLKGEDLIEAMQGAAGLIVRSETKVTREMLAALPELRVVGRAGVGVDNIDIPAATENGVVVMNAPDGNTITTAEHTMALLVSMARNVPQACASLRSGKWDKKRYTGVELYGKTLGIIGLGRIGRTVAERAQGYGMRVLAFDPFVSPEQAGDMEIELAALDAVVAAADFLTVHTPLTPETRGLIGRDAFLKMKRGVRVINCARGGLIDEGALVEAIDAGIVAAAALDVFEQEPPDPSNPLLSMEQVVVTPHLGASTAEAQEGVAVTVAEQMRDFLKTGALRGAVNVPAVAASELKSLQPFLEIAVSMGRFAEQLIDGPVSAIRLNYAGELADLDAAAVTRAFVAGLLSRVSARVNAVNAMHICEERGISVSATYFHGAYDDAPAIRATVRSRGRELTASATVFARAGGGHEDRITEIDGFRIEAAPRGNLIVLRNRDTPGVIGKVGTVLGAGSVNISNFHLGRREMGGDAMAVIETDSPIDENTLEKLGALAEVIEVRPISL